MTRTHGWGDKGKPLIDKAPHGHRKTLTFIAGLRHDGIVAPCVIDGPINGENFTAWVEQFLIPELEPGSIVVIDSLGSHKGKAVRKLLEAAGIKLFFLPPYSPDLNPIEQVFAKLKSSRVGRAQGRGRSRARARCADSTRRARCRARP
jgi:putative transposase